MKFYDRLAMDYDQMTGFSNRLKNEILIFDNIFKKFPACRILDAGCGTGFHTIVFSSLGKEVVGIDNSGEMIHRARQNARKFNLSIKFTEADFLSIPAQQEKPFDAVYCLGNSFVHLLTVEQQELALRHFKQILVPGGYIFLQLLNYDKILRDRPEIISAKEVDGWKYLRSYTYHEITLTFTIRIESATGTQEISNEIYPLRSDELSRLAAQTGLSKINWFGNLSLHDYQKDDSDNLCAVLSD